MEILGIGPTEFLFILIILLLVLGPTDLVTLGQKTGRLIRKLRSSQTWIMVTNLSRALRNLPQTLADETGVDEIRRAVEGPVNRTPGRGPSLDGAIDRTPDANQIRPPSTDAFAAWTTPKPPIENPAAGQEPEPDAPAES